MLWDTPASLGVQFKWGDSTVSQRNTGQLLLSRRICEGDVDNHIRLLFVTLPPVQLITKQRDGSDVTSRSGKFEVNSSALLNLMRLTLFKLESLRRSNPQVLPGIALSPLAHWPSLSRSTADIVPKLLTLPGTSYTQLTTPVCFWTASGRLSL